MKPDRGHSDEPQDLLETLPAGPEEAPRAFASPWGLFEVLLKAPDRVNPFLRVPGLQARLALGFTLITVVGMSLLALTLFASLRFSPPEAIPLLLHDRWDGSWRGLAGLLAVYPGGILAATLVVLPGYWFLGLLAGVRMPLGEVLAHSLRGKAATTVLVLGLLPIYAVLILCLILFRAPWPLVNLALWLGLLLPFLAALRGAWSVESGFRSVVATTPDLRRASRASIPASLTVLWALLFTLTVPVVLYAAWRLATGLSLG